MIKHHVNEEEKRDGMFVKARHSDMDLKALGEQLASRKAQLMGTERKLAPAKARVNHRANSFRLAGDGQALGVPRAFQAVGASRRSQW